MAASDIIKKIKEKKPLNRLDNEFVESYLSEFLKRDFKLNKKFSAGTLRKHDEGKIVKGVRSQLNKVYGQFWLDNKLTLDSHKSTKERKGAYSILYKKIFSVTKRPKKILDLGCGLNPLTYNMIGNDVYFIATELTDYDCRRLIAYFNKNNINGEVVKADLRTYNQFPNVDVCFMFKFLDSVDFRRHKIAEYLVSTINAEYLVVSFSTQSIKGMRMNYPRRGWFEVMLKRLGYSYEKFCLGNEVFYAVRK